MKKEDLMKLGLDEDTATKIADASTVELQGFIPKARFDEVNTLKNEYQTKVDELSKSTGNADELKQKLEALQVETTAKEAEYQTKLQDLSATTAFKLKLAGKAHDVDYVIGQLDRSQIEFDDKGNIVKGFDEQVEALKQQKAFAFVSDPTPPPAPNPGFFVPKVGAGKQPNPPAKTEFTLGEAIYEKMQTQN